MDPVVLQQRLTEAETAYHRLMTSGGLVQLRHGIEETRYEKADADRLRLYINELRAQLGLAPVSPPRAAWRRPVWV